MSTVSSPRISGKPSHRTKVAKLVEFAHGGDTVYLGGGSECNGYGNPEKPHAAKPGDIEIPDGTPVIDVRKAVETRAGFEWALRGPLLNVDLPPGSVERCPQPSDVMSAAVAENDYGALLALQGVHRAAGPEEPGPLDYVPIDVWVAGWRAHGARIGEYRRGQIVWQGAA